MATSLERTGDPESSAATPMAAIVPDRAAVAPWVIVFRGADGRQVKRTFARTQIKAREGKREAKQEVALARAHAKGRHRTEPQQDCPECARKFEDLEREQPTLHEYLLGWIERYQGAGRPDTGKRLELRTGACFRTTRSATSPMISSCPS